MSASKAIAPLEQVCRTIGSEPMQVKLQQALPAGISLDRFTQTTLTALQTKPDLIEAEHNSLYNAVVRAATDGLMPDGRQGAIVAYSTKIKLPNGQERWIKKAQWMCMVEGCIHKLTKAGVHAYAVSVYANDEFELWNDEIGQHVRHRPPPRFGKRGERVGAFAMGRVIATGAVYVEPMDMDELRRVMKVSKSAELDKEGKATKGPWHEWPERMEQKSCLHRLDKRIGTSALGDDEYDGQENQPQLNLAPMVVPDPPAPIQGASEKPKRPSALQKMIDQSEYDESGAGGDAQADATSATIDKTASDEKAGSAPVSPHQKGTETYVDGIRKSPDVEQSGDEVF